MPNRKMKLYRYLQNL